MPSHLSYYDAPGAIVKRRLAAFLGRRLIPGRMTPVLEARGLRRAFGPHQALDGVDLTIGPGEIYGLLGPNGAGKTSLVRAVTGRLRLDAGTVTLTGRDPRADPAARRSLGLVPQDVALYPDLTIRENLSLLGELAGLSRRAAGAAVDPVLAWIELTDRGGSLVGTLSGGQKRRVNVAAATLHQPALLVLDEPTVGVDLPARDRIHGMLRDLRARGTSMLLATHDLDQAALLADRVGIMADGRIRAEGAPAELISRWFAAGSRELVLSLAATADDGGRAALEQAGFVAGADPLVWVGTLASGLLEVPPLLQAIDRAGIPLRDATIREPGLAGVFRRVVGRELTT